MMNSVPVAFPVLLPFARNAFVAFMSGDVDESAGHALHLRGPSCVLRRIAVWAVVAGM